MELDNLRRQWQQQPTEAPTTEQALRTLLTASSSTNPLLRLKKNASRELRWVIIAVALLLFDSLVFARHLAGLQLFVAGLLVLLGLVGVIVYQRLRVIRQMEQQHDNLYRFLQSRIARFRRLMRLHDYVGVVALSLLALVGLLARRADLQPDQPAWGWHLAAAGGGLVIVLGLIYAGYAVGKKEHQHRYGQYLDQLEAALRELEEAA